MTARRLEPAVRCDYLSERGARELAAQIERFWHNLGHHEVATWVELSGGAWSVRSSLKAGLPPSGSARSPPAS